MEQSETINDERLDKIAKALGTTPKVIKEFDNEAPLQNIFNAPVTDNNNYFHCTFNPIDKIVELYDELLKREREKVKLLQQIKGKEL